MIYPLYGHYASTGFTTLHKGYDILFRHRICIQKGGSKKAKGGSKKVGVNHLSLILN